jgi:heavy metal sensor kinase
MQSTQSPITPRIDAIEDFIEVPDENGDPVRVYRLRTLLFTGEPITVFVRTGDFGAGALRSFLLISLVLIPVTAVAAALGAGVLLERLLQPLRRLVEATREIGIGGLSRRLPAPERPSDLQDLAHSFNGMLMRLERAVDALRRFTADASHELRTPLTSIQGSVQVALSRPRSTEDLRETLAEVMEESEWMLHLVDGLLTLARSEEGSPILPREPVDLHTLLEDAIEVGQLLAGPKPVDVRADLSDSLVVHGSAGQLRQVFLNLVSNAVKFTDSGRVTVSARRVQEGDGANWVEVRVSDTGVGITPTELPRVFDRFYRGDAARARPGGTGLGLAIAKLLVEQHGGRIDVQSRVGQGSEFRVLLPEGPPEHVAAEGGANETKVDERTGVGEGPEFHPG